MAYDLYLNDPQMQTVDETAINGQRWLASDWYRLLSKVVVSVVTSVKLGQCGQHVDP